MRILLACLLVLLMPEWDVDAQFGRRRRGLSSGWRAIFSGQYVYVLSHRVFELYGR